MLGRLFELLVLLIKFILAVAPILAIAGIFLYSNNDDKTGKTAKAGHPKKADFEIEPVE